MSRYGIFIDYHYCTGCHTCEIACQQENGYAAGQFGITVTEHILQTKDGLSINYVPFLTDLCHLCMHRKKHNKKPACVKHCLAQCLVFGTINDLLAEARERPKGLLHFK